MVNCKGLGLLGMCLMAIIGKVIGPFTNHGPTDIASTVITRCLHELDALQQRIHHGTTDQHLILRTMNGITRNMNRLRGQISDDDIERIGQIANDILNHEPRLMTAGAWRRVNNYVDVTGNVGRPRIAISRHYLEFLIKSGFTISRIARLGMCDVSTSTLYRRCRNLGIQIRRGRVVDDAELDIIVARLNRQFPNSGYREITVLIRNEGIYAARDRVAASLARIDPLGTAQRWAQAIPRRIYSVRCPNSLWHLDTHQKLIRWHLTITGGIDGFSRVITHLHCSNNNRALTTFYQFLSGIHEFGLPLRVRVDHGTEMVDVRNFIQYLRGPGHFITGRSVHNQRIERLWRDVYTKIVSKFARLFREMEEVGVLDPNSQVNITALHLSCIPIINNDLQQWRNAHNNHPLRTEGNRTPVQLFTQGMLTGNVTDSVESGFERRIRNLTSDFMTALELHVRLQRNVGLPDINHIPLETVNYIHNILQGVEEDDVIERYHIARRLCRRMM